MRKRDEIDLLEARKFAWGAIPTDDESTAAPPSPPVPPVTEEQKREAEEKWAKRVREVHKECELIASAVERTWLMTDLAQQAQATERLWSQSLALGLGFSAMSDWPRPCVRLARLLVRHRDRLDPDIFDKACSLMGWASFSHTETGDLVIEMASSGDEHLHTVLWLALHSKAIPQSPSFGEELGRVIDLGPTWTSRRFALDFAVFSESEGVLPATLRALRAPNPGIRWRALCVLKERFPSALRAEDVLCLLEDAVIHPLPSGRGEEYLRGVIHYPEELSAAVVRLRPEGGDAPLIRILRYDCVYKGFRSELDQAWALRTPPYAYPSRALPFVDRALRAAYVLERYAGVEAAAGLPPDLARPRLLFAAEDGAPAVSSRAREHWMKLYSEPCPTSEIETVKPLLGGKEPSEQLKARMLALRGPREARLKMLQALLAEAPDPEVLAAIAVGLADDSLMHPPDPDLPKDSKAWCAEIVRRFGSCGVRMLCLLAERYGGRGSYGWMNDLANLAEKSPLSEEALTILQEMAVRSFEPSAPPFVPPVLRIFVKAGFPARLQHDLWTTALRGKEKWLERIPAAAALAAHAEPAFVDDVVIVAMEAALAVQDYNLVARAAKVAVERGVPRGIALTKQAVLEASERTDLSQETLSELTWTAKDLRTAGDLSETWVLDALRRPATCGFAIATRIAGRSATPEQIALWKRALGSPARSGASAGEALKGLLENGALSARSRRIQPILEAAPLAIRADLVATLVVHKVPMGKLWPLFEPIFTCSDPEALKSLERWVGFLVRVHKQKCLEVYPRVTHRELAEKMQIVLRLPDPWRSYWQTDPQDREEEW